MNARCGREQIAVQALADGGANPVTSENKNAKGGKLSPPALRPPAL